MPRQKPKALSTEAAFADGPARSSWEAAACWGGGGAKGPAHQECSTRSTGYDPGGSEEDMPTSQVKPFDIPKQMVWEAYRQVAANKGAPGVDEQTLGEFESDLKNNLYRDLESDELWVATSRPRSRRWRYRSRTAGVRVLGVPTVADRVAQTVVAMYWSSGRNPGSIPTPMVIGREVGP